MTTREDLAKATELYLSLFALAVQVHNRDRHSAKSGGELIGTCPHFPCNLARDMAEEILREYGKAERRIADLPKLTLVPNLDMCAVAEQL